MAVKKKEEGEEQITPQVSVKKVSSEIVQKLQIIAGQENVAINDVYNKAFETYVGLYEKKNGKIKIKPKGGGLDVI